MFDVCPTVCNANLAANILASFALTDNTRVLDTTCNGVLFLTDDPGLNAVSVALSGAWLTTASRTRTIGSLEEITAHYKLNSPTYRAARDFFANVGQRGVAAEFLLGYWDSTTPEAITVALDAINNCNGCWTHVAMVHYKKNGTTILMDTVTAQTVGEWAQANEKIAYLVSVDVLNETAGTTTTFKARLALAGASDQFVLYAGKGQCAQKVDVNGVPLYFAVGAAVLDVDGNAIQDPLTLAPAVSDGTTPQMERYHPYTEFLVAGWIAAADLTQSDSGYDIANKPQGGLGFVGVEPTIITNGGLTVVTGRHLDGTFTPNNNGYASVYIRNENMNGVQFGMTAGGLWIDQIHLRIFLRRRIKDALTRLFVNARRVPYDDARGAQMLANAVGAVMIAAQSAGHFVEDIVRWEDYGNYLRKGTGWVIRSDSFATQTAARKHARIAPALSVCYVPAGATNFVPVTLCTLAVPTAS